MVPQIMLQVWQVIYTRYQKLHQEDFGARPQMAQRATDPQALSLEDEP